MTARACPDDNLGKFLVMSERRLNNGQHIFQPYLGCREFPAFVEPATGPAQAVAETREMGWMLYDMEYERDRRPRFFKVQLEDGVMRVLAWEEAVTG